VKLTACVLDGVVPVTVTVYEPVADPALTISIADAPAMIGEGLIAALAPDGSPETDSVITSADPPVMAVPIAIAPALP
jgi:hypothetical protein